MAKPSLTSRLLVIAATIGASAGCAHQAEQKLATQEQHVAALQQRLDEAERTNGRLTVRIEELEDDVFLLQDRVDANRIALQRRGIMGPRAHAQAQQKPGPSPETYWGANAPYRDQPGRTAAPVTRIPLENSNDKGWTGEDEVYRDQIPVNTARVQAPPEREGGELVIGEKEFAEFEGRSPRKSSPTSSGSSNRKAQEPVTDQKLPTTDQLNSDDGAAEKEAAPSPAKKKDALRTYKDALADYRGGKYQQALGGFQSFLASGPRADYMDNALYWIGECHFGLGAYDQAVGYFQRVMSEQPDGNKVPDAMLKMSIAYDRVGKGPEATRLLEDLTRQYPATNAGKLATQKLEERR